MEENLGLLSNDEVLAVLKDREADKQPVISRATPSEIQVRSGIPRRMWVLRAAPPFMSSPGQARGCLCCTCAWVHAGPCGVARGCAEPRQAGMPCKQLHSTSR